MTTRFVPVVVVLPATDYETLLDLARRTEFPADVRVLMSALTSDYGWTHEMVVLGRILSIAAEGEREKR